MIDFDFGALCAIGQFFAHTYGYIQINDATIASLEMVFCFTGAVETFSHIDENIALYIEMYEHKSVPHECKHTVCMENHFDLQ